ncbi:MAG: helix-turn-helix transcriptional regulator [Verrucomicrobia bacterium]|nr:helix-turn-helix transcriptional regulator [Verrucomicrobiota bacterium]
MGSVNYRLLYFFHGRTVSVVDHGLTKESEVANREVAQRIYELRQRAGLTQTELARRVGTTQSVISRLEDADYEGHSLAMLNRIAAAVERRVEGRFVPRRRRPQPA